MDTLKILLGATLALLVGALIVFVNNMNEGMADEDPEEISEMRRQLKEMDQELTRMREEKERRSLGKAVARPDSGGTAATEPAGSGSVDSGDGGTEMSEAEMSESEVRDLEERLKKLESDAEGARDDAERAEAEANLLAGREMEDRDKVQRRARIIRDAMVVATVQEWVENPELGSVAAIEIQSESNVQSGTVLAIRRNSGILGKLKVARVTQEGAIANPMTVFDEVKPQPGDELILNAVVEMAD